MHDRLIGPVDDEIVLNQVVGPKTKEINTGRHEIASLGRSGCLDHYPNGNAGVIALPFQIKFPANIHDDLARGVQIIDARYKRQENAHRSVDRSPIETAQLFFENVGVFETESQPADSEIGVHSIPTFLIDTDIDGAER